ncbi:MAG TPA: HAMP domain-containing sensor histidine kinase, partial [Polyangiales bacterium]|nr:HAMP domain-containing sensor histidine kinase [Polyangiales bacterium]
KLATLGQLSARLAHEIGSPLQILEGRLSALKRELGADAASARLVTIALEQTQRITRVVSQILNVARPAPTMSFECEPGRAAAQIAEFLEMEAKRRGVKLDIDVSEAPRRVAVDADHISQIVLNLVRNALEATPSGGKVTLSLHNGRGPTGDELRIRVQDTGGGIREEDRERIFEPFFTTRGEGEGTGLGLSIVRSLVRRYGGSITFTSPPGQGSCFDVAIPLSRANDAVTNDEVDPEVNEEVHHD